MIRHVGREPLDEIRSKDRSIRRTALDILVHSDSDKATETLARIAEGSARPKSSGDPFYTPEERHTALEALEYRESKTVMDALVRIIGGWPQPYGPTYTNGEQFVARGVLVSKLKGLQEDHFKTGSSTKLLGDLIKKLIRIFNRTHTLTGQIGVIRMLGHCSGTKALQFLERISTPVVTAKSVRWHRDDWYNSRMGPNEIIYEVHEYPVANPLGSVLRCEIERRDGTISPPVENSDILRYRKYANQVINAAKSNLSGSTPLRQDEENDPVDGTESNIAAIERARRKASRPDISLQDRAAALKMARDAERLSNPWLQDGIECVRREGNKVTCRRAEGGPRSQDKCEEDTIYQTQMTSEVYQKRFAELVAEGYRLKYVKGQGIDGRDYYDATWNKSTGPSWISHHAMTAKGYLDYSSRYRSQGYRWVYLISYNIDDSDLRFAAIWRKCPIGLDCKGCGSE